MDFAELKNFDEVVYRPKEPRRYPNKCIGCGKETRNQWHFDQISKTVSACDEDCASRALHKVWFN